MGLFKFYGGLQYVSIDNEKSKAQRFTNNIKFQDLNWSVIYTNKNYCVCSNPNFILVSLQNMRSQSQGSAESGQAEGQQIHSQTQLLLFDWKHRWLKGHEYEHILKNADSYCQKFGFQKYPKKIHPNIIYEQPTSGIIYFVEGNGLGSDFGFPRVQNKKKFRWKKMNFPTNLPKTNPKVTYIVASTTNCHQINQSQQPLFRMHVVTLYEESRREQCGVILCHVLEIKKGNQPIKINQCTTNQGTFDYYKLFACLNNTIANRR